MRFAAIPILMLAAASAASQSPADLLGRAAAAFERNRQNEKHWNWTTTERREVVDRSGKVVQPLPGTTIESVIRADGKRCTEILSWSDGTKPFESDGQRDTHCGGTDETSFQLAELFHAAHVKRASTPGRGVALAIQRDKSLLNARDPGARCAASIEATIWLDPATSFPMHLEGRVVETGCEGTVRTELHYGEEQPRQSFRQMLRKGTAFRIEYALQKDKFGQADRDYWIAVEQHWTRPFREDASGLVYWNRRFDVDRRIPNRSLVLDSRTEAREFGATSELKPVP